jgi:hypothetical protein
MTYCINYIQIKLRFFWSKSDNFFSNIFKANTTYIRPLYVFLSLLALFFC